MRCAFQTGVESINIKLDFQPALSYNGINFRAVHYLEWYIWTHISETMVRYGRPEDMEAFLTRRPVLAARLLNTTIGWPKAER